MGRDAVQGQPSPFQTSDQAFVVTVPGNDDKGYSAYSPDVSGCAAVGDTEEETRRNFQDALIAHFEDMREAGEVIRLLLRMVTGCFRVRGSWRH